MNHLIIGLGGTGGKVIRAFRKQVYAEYRAVAPAGLDVGFLYVDSDPDEFKPDQADWKVLGTSVQLPVASQLNITGENLGARLKDIQSYPGIKPWIGDRTAWGEIIGAIVGAALGGQKRRLGRFLFACKIEKFREQVQSQVRTLQSNGRTEITFHVVAGLAGGTGSGTIVDAVAQLRAMYNDAQRHRIVLYLLLPEEFPQPNWDSGNYHSNGYAALVELNALSTGAYHPVDLVTGNRLVLGDPFNGAYVFGNENENGYQADVKNELPGIVGDYLFQKIAIADKVGWKSLGRMENAENGDGTPETTPGARVGERSKRFLSFGIKRIAIPEEEIGEYLSLNFARAAIQQLRSNNWQDGQGFVDSVRNIDTASFVREAETLGRWLLTDDHLTLSVPILQADDPNKKWRALGDEWDGAMTTFKSMVRDGPPPGWLDELHKYAVKRFDEGFRNAGVPSFYRTKAVAKRDMAREVRGRVERELFDDWRNGTRSAAEVSRVLGDLTGLLTDRLQGIDGVVAREREAAETANEALHAVQQRWAGMGLLGRMVGNRNNLLDEYGLQLREHFVRRTRVEAWMVGKTILGEVLTELADLRAVVDQITATMQDALTRVGAGIDARLKTGGGDDIKGHLVRFYDPDLVRAVTRELVLDQTQQATQTAKVRAALIERAGPNPGFLAFRDRVGLGDMVDRIESVAEDNARVAHDTLVLDIKRRILGVSIIGKLRERFGGDRQALGAYVANLVREAGCYLTVNPLESGKSGPGIPAGVQTLVQKWIVVLPKATEHAAFVADLKSAFKDAQPGDLEFIEADGRANEITMIAVKNLFPLRYLKVLPFLKAKYETRIAANPARFALELHTEGSLDTYPSLYVRSGDELRRDALALVLIGRGLGLVQDDPKGPTYHGRDADGFEAPPVRLGTSLLVAAEAIDDKLYAQLKADIDGRLAKTDDLEPVKDAIRTAPDVIKPLVGGDVADPRYRAVVEAAKAALMIIRR